MLLKELGENRCVKCPAFYDGCNGEDYDYGCIIRQDVDNQCLYDEYIVNDTLWVMIQSVIKSTKEAEEAYWEHLFNNQFEE